MKGIINNMLVDALLNRIENHDFPFNHWTVDQPLSEKAIDEVYGVNLPGLSLIHI